MSVERDINKRWEAGTDHHPKSKELYKILEIADWKFGGDYFEWESGGDGDNGETLMYALDVYFDCIDAGEEI